MSGDITEYLFENLEHNFCVRVLSPELMGTVCGLGALYRRLTSLASQTICHPISMSGHSNCHVISLSNRSIIHHHTPAEVKAKL